MNRCARGGMTLLEVVLALGLATVIITGAWSMYAFLLDARRGLADGSAEAMAERLVMDAIAEDLRSANASRFLQMGLNGGGGRITFVRAAEPSPAVWVPAAVDQTPPPPESDLRMIGYELRIARDEDGREILDEEGNRVVLGLQRRVQKVLTAPNVEEGERFEEVQQVQATLLTSRFKFLRFRFYTGQQWVGRWSGGDLPRAVRVILGRRPLGDDEDLEAYLLEEPTLQRVVYLPVAEGAAAGPAGGARPGPDADADEEFRP